MDRKVGLRMFDVAFYAEKDPYYRQLLDEYHMRDRELQEALKTMTRRQQDVVLDYGGLIAQMYVKMLEFACAMLVKAEEEKTRE